MSSEDFSAEDRELSKDSYGIKKANKVLIVQNLADIDAAIWLRLSVIILST